jgi:hypothetical protein
MSKSRALVGFSLFLLVLAGCAPPISVVSYSTSTATAVPTATLVPTTTPTTVVGVAPTAPPSLVNDCFINPGVFQARQIGDMLYTPMGLNTYDYPGAALPDAASLTQPFKLIVPSQVSYTADFPNSPYTNPLVTGQADGFGFEVCNASTTQSHVLHSIIAKIVSLTPYTGQLSEWNGCDTAITSQHQIVPFGMCRPEPPAQHCMCFHAKFPTPEAAGSAVEMTQTDAEVYAPGPGQGIAGTLPLTLAPRQSIWFQLDMDQPTTPGLYEFTFGLMLDDAGITFDPYTGHTVLLAPVAHKWSGQACLSQPALLAQITPTSPETYYICGL